VGFVFRKKKHIRSTDKKSGVLANSRCADFRHSSPFLRSVFFCLCFVVFFLPCRCRYIVLVVVVSLFAFSSITGSFRRRYGGGTPAVRLVGRTRRAPKAAGRAQPGVRSPAQHGLRSNRPQRTSDKKRTNKYAMNYELRMNRYIINREPRSSSPANNHKYRSSRSANNHKHRSISPANNHKQRSGRSATKPMSEYYCEYSCAYSADNVALWHTVAIIAGDGY
jgi:hypothetical protein